MSSVQCVICEKEFDWDQAYKQQHTPGSHLHNPPGHGNFRPRAFCPYCGSLVAEWDIDRHADRDRWKWYGENSKKNCENSLPPSPLLLWGRSIPPDAHITVAEECININLVKRLHGEDSQEEIKDQSESETTSLDQIFTEANAELDRWFHSRAKYLDRTTHAFQALKSYIEGKGESDARAIALLGMIEYYDDNRDIATEMFERAVKLNDLCALSHLGLGILDYWEENGAQRGVERLSRAIALDLSLVEAYVWKARIQKQKLKDAGGAWNTLQGSLSAIGEDQIKEQPRGYALFLELGLSCIYDGKGGVDDAIRYFETALQMNQNDYTAPMYLMHLYQALGRSVDAARTQAAYEKADRGNGLSSEALNTVRAFVSQSSKGASEQKQGADPVAKSSKPVSTTNTVTPQEAMERPKSITVIAWTFIGITGLTFFALGIDNSPVHRNDPSMVFVIVYNLTLLIGAISLLRGRNWARYLLVFGFLVPAIFGSIYHAISIDAMFSVCLPVMVFTAIIGFFLFRPATNDYFRAQRIRLVKESALTPIIPEKPTEMQNDKTVPNVDSEAQSAPARPKTNERPEIRINQGQCPFLGEGGRCEPPGAENKHDCSWETQGKGQYNDCFVYKMHTHPGGWADFLRQM